VWTHGGAFVGGSKEEIGGYLRIIAGAGFTVVGVRYSLAPEARHPTPTRQLLQALRHLEANADRLHVDPDRFVLAGDSAGAQISAQAACVLTNPEYATQIGVAPLLRPEQVRGVALCCGVFDLAMVESSSPFRMLIDAVGWAYSGARNFRDDDAFISAVSVPAHTTAEFPPAFLTVGNADPLERQSHALATVLESKGVDVERLFYPDGHTPALDHEYQFDLDLDDARVALDRMTAFFRRVTT
jgi:acetyl esterase